MAVRTVFDELEILRDEFTESLKARNRASLTIKSYRLAVDQLRDFLRSKGMPMELRAIRREHIEAFLVDLEGRGLSPATRAQRFRSLQQAFKFGVENDEIPISPMQKMRPVQVEPPLVPVLRPEEVKRLLRACDGREFADRRDAAVIRLFLSTGVRRQEMASLALEDLDFDHRTVVIQSGKGSRPRIAAFGAKTRTALMKYMNERARHPKADSSALWLGRFGPLTHDGIRDIVERRGKAAGIDGLHPHVFRHSAAHEMLAAGFGETDVQQLMGWRSPQMLRRYGSSAATERAIEAHHRVAIDDRY